MAKACFTLFQRVLFFLLPSSRSIPYADYRLLRQLSPIRPFIIRSARVSFVYSLFLLRESRAGAGTCFCKNALDVGITIPLLNQNWPCRLHNYCASGAAQLSNWPRYLASIFCETETGSPLGSSAKETLKPVVNSVARAFSS